MRVALLAGVLLVVTACGDAGLNVTPTATTSPDNMAQSALVDSVVCKSDDRGAVASGTLQNVSDETWAYDVVVEWRDRSGKFYTGDETRTADLPPGGTFLWEVVPDVPEAVLGTCEVIDVVQLVPGGEAVAFPTDASPVHASPAYSVPPDGN